MTALTNKRTGRNPEWLAHYHAPERDAERDRDLARRMRAAGIDPDGEVPQDIDAFRYQLARRIAMFINDWPGCPERICRRMRGCMAPNNVCSNRPAKPPMTPEESGVLRMKVRRALDAVLGTHGGTTPSNWRPNASKRRVAPRVEGRSADVAAQQPSSAGIRSAPPSKYRSRTPGNGC